MQCKKRKGFHFAKLDSSPQLQSLYGALKRRKGKVVTSFQLFRETGLMSISTRVAELRANKIEVSDAIYLGKSATGARVYGWQLLQKEVA